MKTTLKSVFVFLPVTPVKCMYARCWSEHWQSVNACAGCVCVCEGEWRHVKRDPFYLAGAAIDIIKNQAGRRVGRPGRAWGLVKAIWVIVFVRMCLHMCACARRECQNAAPLTNDPTSLTSIKSPSHSYHLRWLCMWHTENMHVKCSSVPPPHTHTTNPNPLPISFSHSLSLQLFF